MSPFGVALDGLTYFWGQAYGLVQERLVLWAAAVEAEEDRQGHIDPVTV